MKRLFLKLSGGLFVFFLVLSFSVKNTKALLTAEPFPKGAVLGEQTYQSTNLYNKNKTSLSVTPVAYDSNSGKWNYKISWQRPPGKNGSIYVNGKSVASQAWGEWDEQTGYSLAPSKQIKITFYSLSNGKGGVLISRYFKTLPSPQAGDSKQITGTSNSAKPPVAASQPVLPSAPWVADPVSPLDPSFIVWSASRPLVWSDFTGPIAATSSLEGAAVSTPISSVAHISHQCGGTQNTNQCTYRIDSFEVIAVMDPASSWVRTKSDSGLAHEQTHFNIAEAYARKLQQELAPLVNATASSSNELLQKKQTIEQSVSDQMEAAQELYDSQTNHSLNVSVQLAWQGCVSNWLQQSSPSLTCQITSQ